MDYEEQLETNAVQQKIRHHPLRRGIYLLPSFFTVLNLGCGYYAVLATLKGEVQDLDNAAKAIGLAILFDSLDGRIARMTGTNSEFGKQFDSLADIVSFGIAPAVLAFAWGVRGLLESEAAQARNLYQLGWVVMFAFVLSCAWRLARFNIQGMAPGTSSKYFAGMPTPAGAGMIAATVHAFKYPLADWRISLLWLAIVGGLAALMSSTIRYYSGKDINFKRPRTSLVIIVMGLLIWSVVLFSEQVLLLFASAYTLSGIILSLVRSFRARRAPHAPSSTPSTP